MVKKDWREKVKGWSLMTPTPAKNAGEVLEAVISKVEVQTGKEIFGDKAVNSDREYLRIYADRGGKNVPIGTIALPDDVLHIHPRSNAGRFILMYGKPPKPGVRVKVRVTDKGFWQLVL